jgi:fructokinase
MDQGSDRDVLVVGESLVDVVRRPDGTTTEYAGGSAANVAVALARLGRPVRLATAFAEDQHGEMIRGHLARAGVVLATEPGVVARTSTAQATIGADGAASYDFDLDWRLGDLDPEPVPLVVHTCSLGAVLEPGASQVVAMVSALRGRATVTYDINARPAVTGTGPGVVSMVERMVALADLVKCSDEDLEALYPERELVRAARELLQLGPAAVVVTRGSLGSLWLGGRGSVEIASRSVDVADTIGAGDTFGAALVDALWERGRLGGDMRDRLGDLDRMEITEVLEHAARAASVTVSRPGADPPYRHELA